MLESEREKSTREHARSEYQDHMSQVQELMKVRVSPILQFVASDIRFEPSTCVGRQKQEFTCNVHVFKLSDKSLSRTRFCWGELG